MHAWVILENTMLRERRQMQKGHMYDFTHMKCPEQTNPKRLKVDWWFQGLERAGRSSERLMGPGFNFGGM